MIQLVSNSVSDTEGIGKKIAEKYGAYCVIALFGQLGMGKTAFARGFASYFGISRDVSSPTFAILNEYSGSTKIFHFDMYRISGPDDLYSTGFYDCIGEGAIIIEWSENIEDCLPSDAVKIRISAGKNENQRIFEIEGADLL